MFAEHKHNTNSLFILVFPLDAKHKLPCNYEIVWTSVKGMLAWLTKFHSFSHVALFSPVFGDCISVIMFVERHADGNLVFLTEGALSHQHTAVSFGQV